MEDKTSDYYYGQPTLRYKKTDGGAKKCATHLGPSAKRRGYKDNIRGERNRNVFIRVGRYLAKVLGSVESMIVPFVSARDAFVRDLPYICMRISKARAPFHPPFLHLHYLFINVFCFFAKLFLDPLIKSPRRYYLRATTLSYVVRPRMKKGEKSRCPVNKRNKTAKSRREIIRDDIRLLFSDTQTDAETDTSL